ncbi:MAG: hypothetical protein NXI32_25650 [bacterium]|nr:hypothetical protein [bacterium]
MSMATSQQQFEWLAKEGVLILQEIANTSASYVWKDQADLNAWQNSLLREQLALRRRSRKRFPDPDRWLFTDRSLSQASDWWSADFKSRLWPADSRVLDVCCGAGVDLTAISRRVAGEGIDRDQPLLELTKANLRLHQCNAKTNCGEVDLEYLASMREKLWLHADPDRRPAGKKILTADSFSPALDGLLDAASRSAGAMIKIAPATRFSEATSDRVNSSAIRLWLGLLGECRQQLLLLKGIQEQFMASQTASIGGLPDSRRFAVLLLPTASVDSSSLTADSVCECFTGEPHHLEDNLGASICNTSLGPRGYIYDLHSVLHVSGLHVAWAEQHGMQPITNSHGFYCSTEYIATPWAQAFEIIDVVAWDDRKVRKLLRRIDAGLVEVKSRLVKMDATAFQRRYSSASGAAYSLLVTRIGTRVRCMITRRLPANVSV